MRPCAPVRVGCPYCEHAFIAECEDPVSHPVLVQCFSCHSTYVVRFDVAVDATVLTIEGEEERAVAHIEALAAIEASATDDGQLPGAPPSLAGLGRHVETRPRGDGR